MALDDGTIKATMHSHDHLVVWRDGMTSMVFTAMPKPYRIMDGTMMMLLTYAARLLTPVEPRENMVVLKRAYPDMEWSRFQGDRFTGVLTVGVWRANRVSRLADLACDWLLNQKHPASGRLADQERLLAHMERDVSRLPTLRVLSEGERR